MNRDDERIKMASARLDFIPTSAGEPDTKPADLRKGVQSVDQAFAILRVMETAHRALALKELADRLDMPTPKVHHYLVSLVRSGALRQNPEGTYDLGPFALHLGLSALRRLDPVEQSITGAKALRDETGEAVFVAIWGSHGPTIIRYFEGLQPVTVEVRAGLVLPLTTSATGLVFLAFGSSKLIDPILKREVSPSHLPLDRLRKKTRDVGLGMVEGTLLPRIASLSAPIFDRDGRLALVLTSLGWIEEFDTSPGSVISLALKTKAAVLSSSLGYLDN